MWDYSPTEWHDMTPADWWMVHAGRIEKANAERDSVERVRRGGVPKSQWATPSDVRRRMAKIEEKHRDLPYVPKAQRPRHSYGGRPGK